MKYTLTLLITLLVSPVVRAQDVPEKGKSKIPRSGLSINGLGAAGLAGASFDILIKNRVFVEAGGGLGGYGGGLTTFFKSAETGAHNWYTGLKFNRVETQKYSVTNILYIPFGAMLFYPSGFYMGVDVGPGLLRQVRPPMIGGETVRSVFTYPRTSFNAFGNVKLGFRFQTLGNK